MQSKIIWPSDLVVDYSNRRLYWIDMKKQTIETVRLDGSDRHVVWTFAAGVCVYFSGKTLLSLFFFLWLICFIYYFKGDWPCYRECWKLLGFFRVPFLIVLWLMMWRLAFDDFYPLTCILDWFSGLSFRWSVTWLWNSHDCCGLQLPVFKFKHRCLSGFLKRRCKIKEEWWPFCLVLVRLFVINDVF